MLISVPSKTFLLGEYAVLNKAAGIVLNTAPRFQLKLTQTNKANFNGIALESPAGKFYQSHSIFKEFRIDFADPHQGMGGFGASTAQFLLLYAAHQYLTQNNKDIDLETLLNTYLAYAWDNIGIAPSGVDILAQTVGNIAVIDKHNMLCTSLSWPFANLGFILIHTQNKLATHQHLQQLSNLDTNPLNNIIEQFQDAFSTHNENSFIHCIHHYAAELQRLNLVASHTQNMLQQLTKQPDILAAKGCGAMGADVICIISKKSAITRLIAWLKQQKFAMVASNADITKGLTFDEVDR